IYARRRYRRGFSHVVRFFYEAENVTDESVTILVYFGWIPRSAFGRSCLKFGARWLGRRYHEVLPQLAASGASDAPPAEFLVRAENALSETGRARLEHCRRELLDGGLPAALVDKLCDHVQSGDEMELDRIQLKRLAR